MVFFLKNASGGSADPAPQLDAKTTFSAKNDLGSVSTNVTIHKIASKKVTLNKVT